MGGVELDLSCLVEYQPNFIGRRVWFALPWAAKECASCSPDASVSLKMAAFAPFSATADDHSFFLMHSDCLAQQRTGLEVRNGQA